MEIFIGDKVLGTAEVSELRFELRVVRLDRNYLKWTSDESEWIEEAFVSVASVVLKNVKMIGCLGVWTKKWTQFFATRICCHNSPPRVNLVGVLWFWVRGFANQGCWRNQATWPLYGKVCFSFSDIMFWANYSDLYSRRERSPQMVVKSKGILPAEKYRFRNYSSLSRSCCFFRWLRTFVGGEINSNYEWMATNLLRPAAFAKFKHVWVLIWEGLEYQSHFQWLWSKIIYFNKCSTILIWLLPNSRKQDQKDLSWNFHLSLVLVNSENCVGEDFGQFLWFVQSELLVVNGPSFCQLRGAEKSWSGEMTSQGAYHIS